MGEERIVDVEVKREPWLYTSMRESRAHKDIHKENTSPKPLFGKMREAEFMSFATNGAQSLGF